MIAEDEQAAVGIGLLWHEAGLGDDIIAPGESFQYVSGCPLDTPVGTLHGSFQMVEAQGNAFDARIAPFRLMVPNILQ